MAEDAIRDISASIPAKPACVIWSARSPKSCRKVVKDITLHPTDDRTVVTPEFLEKYLGVRRFRYGLAEEQDQIGQVTGLPGPRWVANCSASKRRWYRQG